MIQGLGAPRVGLDNQLATLICHCISKQIRSKKYERNTVGRLARLGAPGVGLDN